MKSILIPLFVLSYLISFAQWDIGHYLDDFGEETEERFLHQTVSGTFSNSESTNAKCTYFIEHNKKEKVLGISIYPYDGNSMESFYEDTFQDVKIKKPSGELVTIEAFCFEGIIYFDYEEYVQLMDALKERGEYKVSMKYKTDDTHSRYRFKFNN